MHNFYLDLVDKFISWGYPGILVMMLLESSFFPFPSEIVMIPGGYLAAQGKFSLLLVILSGIGGSILGAYVNYFLGMKYGRTFILKYGRYFFLSEKQYLSIESLFEKNGSIITLTGRLMPGIRQYISFPAGVTKMPIGLFTLLTGLGAGVWVTFLSLLGFYFGENKEIINTFVSTFKKSVIAIGVLLVIIILIKKFLIIKKNTIVTEK